MEKYRSKTEKWRERFMFYSIFRNPSQSLRSRSGTHEEYVKECPEMMLRSLFGFIKAGLFKKTVSWTEKFCEFQLLMLIPKQQF